MHPLWTLAVLAVAAPIVGRAWWRRRIELRELARIARRRGLTFSALDLIGLHDRYCNLELIRRGHNRHAWNVMYGSVDTGLVALFRYSWQAGFGTRQVVHQEWIAVLECPAPLAGWRTAPAEAQGEPLPTGSRIGGFIIHADRTATARALCEPPLAEVFLSVTKKWHFESRGILLAAAAPFDGDWGVPERLLDCISSIASRLPSAY